MSQERETGSTRWRVAIQQALYGPGGFFLRPEGPARHFRTSVHVSPLFSGALVTLAHLVDEALGHPAPFHVVDMGAGHGELATALLRQVALDSQASGRASGRAMGQKDALRLAERLRVHAVELAERPVGLDPRIEWSAEPPQGVAGLLIANEWLDNVPLDIAEVGEEGVVRYVLVARDGGERLGDPVLGDDAAWLARWWPLREGGTRAEIGLPRDTAWADAAGSLSRGLAVAVDYAHRRATRPPLGTLTGFKEGHQVPAVPDGSRDLTAHVALDSCAAAFPATQTVLTTQRDALHALGVRGERPPLALATDNATAYVQALAQASQAAELTALGGLGSFTWLLQGIGVRVPLPLVRRPEPV